MNGDRCQSGLPDIEFPPLSRKMSRDGDPSLSRGPLFLGLLVATVSRVQHDRFDRHPVPRSAWPSAWILCSCSPVHLLSVLEYLQLGSCVPLGLRDESSTDVAVFVIVPSCEPLYQFPGILCFRMATEDTQDGTSPS